MLFASIRREQSAHFQPHLLWVEEVGVRRAYAGVPVARLAGWVAIRDVGSHIEVGQTWRDGKEGKGCLGWGSCSSYQPPVEAACE